MLLAVVLFSFVLFGGVKFIFCRFGCHLVCFGPADLCHCGDIRLRAVGGGGVGPSA